LRSHRPFPHIPKAPGQPIRRYYDVVTGEAIMGTNAIVAVHINYETIGANGGMMMVSVSGTAVSV
jgi:uncharacterized protein YbjQ (UPF0145 family)